MVDPQNLKNGDKIAFILVGIGKLAAVDGKVLTDPDVIRRLRTSVNSAIDKATAGRSRSRSDQTLGSDQGQLEGYEIVQFFALNSSDTV